MNTHHRTTTYLSNLAGSLSPLVSLLGVIGVLGANSRACRAANPPLEVTAPVPSTPNTPKRLPPSASTPPPMSGVISPSAAALIEQMRAAQADLTSYSAKITLYGESDQEKEPLTVRLFFAYQKSGTGYRFYLRVVNEKEKTTQTFVSDGTNCYGTDASKPLTYTKTKAGKSVDPFLQMVAQSEAGYLATLPLDLVTGTVSDDTKTQITIVKEPDEIVDGAARDVVRMVGVGYGQSSTNGVAVTTRDVMPKTFTLGKTDHLLRRWRFAVVGSENTGTEAPGTKQQTARFTLTFTDVKANPKLPPSLFVFTPAPNATEVQPSSGTNDTGMPH